MTNDSTMTPKAQGRVLAIDYGLARVGLAISDPLRIAAQPLTTLERRGDKHICREIAEIVQERDVREIVVGLPVDMSGRDSQQTQLVQAFIDRLKRHVRIPVETWDERLTTVAAERVLDEASTKRRKKKKAIDQIAAALILEGYLARSRFPSL